MRTCSLIAECSLSYAKIIRQLKLQNTKFMMKQLLLTTSVALFSLGVHAQSTAPNAFRPHPVSDGLDVSSLPRPAANHRSVSAARPVSSGAEDLYGPWVKCETVENDNMLTCAPDTLRAPEDVLAGDVRMAFSPDTYGYGRLDGDVLTFPSQYANDGATFEVVNSHLVICGIKADRETVTDNVVFVRNADGNFELADSLSGWYIYVEDGAYQHMKWWRAYDTVLRRANGTMTSQRTWWFETTEDAVPVSVVKDGLEWNIYGWGPQVKVTVEVSPEDGKTTVQLPQNVYNTAEEDWDSEMGKYVMLCSKKEEGTYEPGELMWDMSEHEVEGTYREEGDEAVVAYPDVTFGTYSLFDSEGMGESMGDYADVVIRVSGLVSNAVARPSVAAAAPSAAGSYNLAGQRVGKDYRGLVIENGVKRMRR